MRWSEPLQPVAAECATCVLGCALDAPWECPEEFPGESVQLVGVDYKINKCVEHPSYNYHDSLLSLSFLYLRSTNSNECILILLRLPVSVTLSFCSQLMDLYQLETAEEKYKAFFSMSWMINI